MARQNYGVSPWGKWFVEVLEGYEMGARLDRGRSYANTGKVLSLKIEAGRAIAKVQGHYRSSYKVEIDFPPLAEKQRVFDLIEEDPSLLARIAAGELPGEFLEKLKREGISLIPRRWKEMRRSCNCPDYGDPCKHMAALYYVIAREIDADPHVLFRLRGLDLEELSRRFGTSLNRTLTPPFTVEAGGAVRERPESPPEWGEIPRCTELILSLLPLESAFSTRNFAVVLGEFYHHAARFVFWEDPGIKRPGAEDAEERRFSRSDWSLECPRPGPGTEPVLLQKAIDGAVTRYSVWEAFTRFRLFSSDDGTENYTFLYYLFKLLGLICSAGAYIPCPVVDGDTLRIVWLVFEGLPSIRDALDSIARYEARMLPLAKTRKNSPGASGAADKQSATKPAAGPGYASGRSVVNLIAHAVLNEWVKRNYFSLGSVRQQGDAAFRDLLNLFFRGEGLNISAPAQRSLPLVISNWLAVLRVDFSAYRYRFTLKTSGKEDFALSMELIVEEPEGTGVIPLKDVAHKTGGVAALKAPTALSNYLPELRILFTKTRVRLSEERLVYFLDSAAELISRLGIEVVFPRELHRELKPRLVLKGEAKKAASLVSYLNLDSILDWHWEVAIGDQTLSAEEFKAITAQKKAVVRFRDQFIRLDPAEVSRLFKQAAAGGKIGPNDFLKAYFAGDSILSFDAEEIIRRIFDERDYPVPAALRAELRPYQRRGYNWVCSLLAAGFGCILADDMGLGKTVQSIAVCLRLKEEGLLPEGGLIIAPASLLENWEQELGRFAPSLSVGRYHGSKRDFTTGKDLFLTTYQTAVRDAAKLAERTFSLLIVDEAHLLKNAETRGSKTVKSLRTRYRLALSGTPVENRLEDLRSLFDFILPGYLGTETEFRKAYRYPIEVERRQDRAGELRRITAPFLLRRLKIDKAIIDDLPEKISINEYAVPEKEQAALYESIVSAVLEKSAGMEDPAGRSALILSLLTSLKQVCDHPRVYDKESPAVSTLSGKARLLVALLEDILVNREKVLVFSQYVETLECLREIIQHELGEAAPIYHGGLVQKKRSEVIDRFSTDPACRILLISLRAGGLGLNLTAASRVIHYDLWYNPAVENQATDRAFRIGQRQNVFVHRFIMRNTFEEKIEAMLTSKRELAEMTVSSGESWLARMSHEELRALFDR
ncbi:MAG: DEAD/DEAH box helicase [Spirochaetaceae bacterium]|nr:DEAD/DEAH box helicase [Spirochaetaceae bacterium]